MPVLSWATPQDPVAHQVAAQDDLGLFVLTVAAVVVGVTADGGVVLVLVGDHVKAAKLLVLPQARRIISGWVRGLQAPDMPKHSVSRGLHHVLCD